MNECRKTKVNRWKITENPKFVISLRLPLKLFCKIMYHVLWKPITMLYDKMSERMKKPITLTFLIELLKHFLFSR